MDEEVTRTPLYRLVEVQLGSSLATYLRAERSRGVSHFGIAVDLVNRTGAAVSHETVRRWCRGLELEVDGE